MSGESHPTHLNHVIATVHYLHILMHNDFLHRPRTYSLNVVSNSHEGIHFMCIIVIHAAAIVTFMIWNEFLF